MIACRMRIVTYSCAFCGEDNDVLVDPSGGRRQTFTEDCAVCCRPNLIMLAFGDDGTVRLAIEADQMQSRTGNERG